jgi:hypothetical protein
MNDKAVPAKRRLRAPKAKPGQLLMQWGKLPGEDPDMCYSWGDGCSKRDGHLLHNALASEKPDLFVQPLFSKMLPSLLADLESRGYDLTTLRFTVSKKAPPNPLN